ncbi:unnamed protein product, partial [Arabidopsis halleri]
FLLLLRSKSYLSFLLCTFLGSLLMLCFFKDTEEREYRVVIFLNKVKKKKQVTAQTDK